MKHHASMRAHLSYIELGSPDPQALSRFYRDAFSADVEVVGDMRICHGPERCVVISPGEAKTLKSAGYAVYDPAWLDGLMERLAVAGVAHERTSTPVFADAVGFTDLSGNNMFFGVPRARAPATKGLPGRIQHVVVATRDAAGMVDFYTRVVGLTSRTGCSMTPASCAPPSCARTTSIIVSRSSRRAKIASIIIAMKRRTGTRSAIGATISPICASP